MSKFSSMLCFFLLIGHLLCSQAMASGTPPYTKGKEEIGEAPTAGQSTQRPGVPPTQWRTLVRNPKKLVVQPKGRNSGDGRMVLRGGKVEPASGVATGEKQDEKRASTQPLVPVELPCPTIGDVNNISVPSTIELGGFKWNATFKSQKNLSANPPANPDTMLNTTVTRFARIQIDAQYGHLLLIYENMDGSVQKMLQLSSESRSKAGGACRPNIPEAQFKAEIGDSGNIADPKLYLFVPSNSPSFPDGMTLICSKPANK
jgi:hypothetical protein